MILLVKGELLGGKGLKNVKSFFIESTPYRKFSVQYENTKAKGKTTWSNMECLVNTK